MRAAAAHSQASASRLNRATAWQIHAAGRGGVKRFRQLQQTPLHGAQSCPTPWKRSAKNHRTRDRLVPFHVTPHDAAISRSIDRDRLSSA